MPIFAVLLQKVLLLTEETLGLLDQMAHLCYSHDICLFVCLDCDHCDSATKVEMGT